MPRFNPYPLLASLYLSLCLQATAAEPLRLATGEFAPFTGAGLEGYGVSSQIVQLALGEAGYDSVLTFLPWRRASAMTAKGQYAGSFPWAKNAERERLFLYSDPLHEDRIRFFTRSNSGMEVEENWQGQTLCIPDGWDTSQVQAQIERYHLQLVRPSDIENCFRMLAAGRFDLTVLNEQVAQSIIRKIKNSAATIVPVGTEVATDVTYLIVSRQYPAAEKLITTFNAGLAKIKADGRYAHLIKQPDKD